MDNYQKAIQVIHISETTPNSFSEVILKKAFDIVEKYVIAEREDKIRNAREVCRNKKKRICEMKNKIFSQLPNCKRKTTIGKEMKGNIWNRYCGPHIGTTLCFACEKRQIRMDEYEAGHVRAESNNGPTTVENLRPVCSQCNKRMGTKNMYTYMVENNYNYSKLNDCEYVDVFGTDFSQFSSDDDM